MENDEFISFGRRLADFFKGRWAAKHWGGGGVPARPREPNSDSFPYQLGARDAFEAAKTAAEQKLMVSPGWDLPRWRKQNSFAVTIHADPVRENWYNLQFVIEPRKCSTRSDHRVRRLYRALDNSCAKSEAKRCVRSATGLRICR